MSLVGLGTQGGLGPAEDFVARFGPFSFPMYWDPGFGSWTQLGVTSQPSAALFAADGTFLAAWLGRFPPAKVAALIAAQPPVT